MFVSRAVAIALMATVLAVSACAGENVDCGAGEMKAQTDATFVSVGFAHCAVSSAPLGRPDRPIAGPQGAMPQFLVGACTPVWGSTAVLTLAGGGLTTGHADFMNGWEKES